MRARRLHAFQRTYSGGVGSAPPNVEPDGYFFTADTLAELAERIINPERVCIRPRPTTGPAPRSS